MDEKIKENLAIEIANKAIQIATLAAQNEELQGQLNQALSQSEADKQYTRGLEAKNAELLEKLRLLQEGEVAE